MQNDRDTPLVKDPQFQRGLLFIALGLAVAVGATIYWGSKKPEQEPQLDPPVAAPAPEPPPIEEEELIAARDWKLGDIPFDGQAALGWVKELCAIGSRTSGTAGMAKQQKLLGDHFKSLGGTVVWQKFDIRHPQTGERTTLANLIITWHPERKERILLAAHYDTRPFPDRDEKNPRGLFVGANDGASGVAVLCELGRQMPKLESRYGVDFVLFDGEELIYTDRDDYFLGSKHFAKEYVANPQGHRYTQGALLDMVGDASLQIYYEQNSITWANTRPVVQSIWKTARRLGVSEFIPRIGHLVRDDHLAIHDDAGIPMCDIIDFDYPHPAAKRSYWHTTDDVPANCSALSLAKVGWVVSEWLKGVK